MNFSQDARMRAIVLLLPILLLLTPMSHARSDDDDEVTDFDLAIETLLRVPLEDIRGAESFTVQELSEADRGAVLRRMADLPKLTTLSFIDCDLSRMGGKDPIPARVQTLLILRGNKVSQGTIDWLAKFPAGVTLVFGCDVHGLDLNLGKFKSVTFVNCKLSRSAVTRLVEKTPEAAFKEVTLVDDK